MADKLGVRYFADIGVDPYALSKATGATPKAICGIATAG
jgi:predicted Zn-dependent protease